MCTLRRLPHTYIMPRSFEHQHFSYAKSSQKESFVKEMLHNMQSNCADNRMPFRTLKLSVTSEGYMLLHPQNEDLISIIQNEDPQHVKHDGVNWTFSMEIQERVIQKVRKARMMVSETVWRYIKMISSTPGYTHSTLDPSVRRKLYNFQILTVEKAFGLGGRILLGDASGLGKKYQALAIASCFHDNKPILIVCNSICACAWQDTARIILGMDIDIVRRISELGEDSCITDHSFIVKNQSCFASLEYGLAIVDDSHAFLNRKSHIEKCFTELLSRTTRVVLITTATRHMAISEWFTVFSIIFKSPFITYKYFKKRYTAFPDELQYLISRFCLIRDRSSILTCSNGTSSKQNDIEHANCPKSVLPVHRRVIKCSSTRRKTSSVALEKWSKELRSKYKREIRHKHNTTGLYLEYLLRKGLRVAVIVHFRRTIIALLKHTPWVKKVVLYGAHRNTDSLECTKFNNGDAPLVLTTYKALKACTFLRVDTVCIAELHLSTRSIRRAEGITGHGVMSDVHYLVEKNGIERCIWECIRRKLET
eukprot:jgi/Antlo1/769/1419